MYILEINKFLSKMIINKRIERKKKQKKKRLNE